MLICPEISLLTSGDEVAFFAEGSKKICTMSAAGNLVEESVSVDPSPLLAQWLRQFVSPPLPNVAPSGSDWEDRSPDSHTTGDGRRKLCSAAWAYAHRSGAIDAVALQRLEDGWVKRNLERPLLVPPSQWKWDVDQYSGKPTWPGAQKSSTGWTRDDLQHLIGSAMIAMHMAASGSARARVLLACLLACVINENDPRSMSTWRNEWRAQAGALCVYWACAQLEIGNEPGEFVNTYCRGLTAIDALKVALRMLAKDPYHVFLKGYYKHDAKVPELVLPTQLVLWESSSTRCGGYVGWQGGMLRRILRLIRWSGLLDSSADLPFLGMVEEPLEKLLLGFRLGKPGRWRWPFAVCSEIGTKEEAQALATFLTNNDPWRHKWLIDWVGLPLGDDVWGRSDADFGVIKDGGIQSGPTDSDAAVIPSLALGGEYAKSLRDELKKAGRKPHGDEVSLWSDEVDV